MEYKVLKSFRGSPDGCRVVDFKPGQVLFESMDFPNSLIDVALCEGWVKLVEDEKINIHSSESFESLVPCGIKRIVEDAMIGRQEKNTPKPPQKKGRGRPRK